jgi:hypothetical protein
LLVDSTLQVADGALTALQGPGDPCIGPAVVPAPDDSVNLAAR